MKKIIILSALVLLAGGLLTGCYSGVVEDKVVVESFEDCVEAGFPVMESYPRQCRIEGGQTFVEDIGNELEKDGLIRVNNPRPGQKITSPLQISGEARGTWFFEGDFPVVLKKSNGEVITTSFATAQSEWMTEDFVPFTAEIVFDDMAGGNGTLILEKDNPSDLPENDDRLEVPVKF